MATIRVICLLTAICGCLTLCSCEPMRVTSPEDYIGPSASAEPNMASAFSLPELVKEPNRVTTGPIRVTITEALLTALENNKSLMVQRYNPQIQRTFEQEDLAIFDPDLTATVSQSNVRAESVPRPGLGSFMTKTREFNADVALSQIFPTGTMLSLDGSTDILDGSFLSQPFVTSRIGFSATQSLLRGFGPSVNLATVNQAKIDVKISQYEIRGLTEALAALTEETYWNYALAEQQIRIYEESLSIAEKQMDETKERIKIGVLAESELVSAEAEVASRRVLLINARSNLVQVRLNLLRLLNPPGEGLWSRQIIIESPPVTPKVELEDVSQHISVAMKMRPELNQAKLQLQRDELELVKTKNGLLPRMDLFVTLGRSGFSDSFSSSVRKISRDKFSDFAAGLNFEYPPENRAAQARNYRAKFTKEQDREAMNNLMQLIEVDVRSAYQEVVRSGEQVTATAASRKLQEEKLRVESEKFKVGTSTSLLVAQAERDFLASQIAEVQAVVSYLNSFIELYRLEGSLLERRGLACPGRETVADTVGVNGGDY